MAAATHSPSDVICTAPHVPLVLVEYERVTPQPREAGVQGLATLHVTAPPGEEGGETHSSSRREHSIGMF